MDERTKKCSRCEIDKPVAEFSLILGMAGSQSAKSVQKKFTGIDTKLNGKAVTLG